MRMPLRAAPSFGSTRTGGGMMSMRIYWAMILVLAVAAAALVFLLQEGAWRLPAAGLPVPRPVLALVNFTVMLVVYGGLGFIGLRLSPRIGFAAIWDERVPRRLRFAIPGLAGMALGVLFVLADLVFSKLHGLGLLPHPPFPASLMASITAGIGEEVLFRLFFVVFWVWLLSHVVLRKRGLDAVFGVVTAVSALLFTAGHLPVVMSSFGLEQVRDVPFALAAELLVLNGSLSVVASLFMRRWGILAAVGVHFWTDVVWHVLWGSSGMA
jgi:hypothetical protein